ncbi:MAG: glycosyltransferase family 39 protein [Alphaproteobacteria bacterium]|nr:glycosyltransferase family 39 protein [Alphaproteobacteria bacterium]
MGNVFGYYENHGDIKKIELLAMGVGEIRNPAVFLFMRILTVLAGVATVAMVYLCGREVAPSESRGRWTGLVGALIVAVSPTLVGNSRYLTPDMWGMLFILASFWASLRVFRAGGLKYYIGAGVAAGLAAGAKYVGGLVIVVLPVAHVLRNLDSAAFSWNQLSIDRRVILAGFLSLLVFVLTTPYAILDAEAFLIGLLSEARHYATGHSGMDGKTLLFYSRLLFLTEGPVTALAFAGLVYGLVVDPKRTVLVCFFPLVYFLMIVDLPVRNERTLMPVLPFLAILAARPLVDAVAVVRIRYPGFPAAALPAVVGLALLVVPAANTYAGARALTAPKPEEAARLWITENLPAGARVLLESYSPYVDPARFDVLGVRSMSDPDVAQRIADDPDYLIFSARMYGRYLYDRARYPERAARYADLFAAYDLVKSFGGGGGEIKIFKSPDPKKS